MPVNSKTEQIALVDCREVTMMQISIVLIDLLQYFSQLPHRRTENQQETSFCFPPFLL